MKRNVPKLMLLFFLLMAKSGQAQWYSYDAFERTYLTRGQLLAMSAAKSSDSLQKKYAVTPAPSIKDVIKDNIAELDAKLKKGTYDATLIRRISVLKQSIATADSTIAAAADDATKKPLIVAQDKLKDTLHYLMSGKERDSLKMLRQEFVYMKKRYQTASLFPVLNSRAAESYFENSDSVITADSSGVFKFEHAYLNYLSNTKTLAAYTEPVHDFIGPVRLSLGLMVLAPAAKDSSEPIKGDYNKKRFKDKFKSGGGNVSINGSFPLLHFKLQKYIDIKSYYSPRFSLDVPDSSGSSVKFPLHAQWLAWDNQLKITTLENKLAFLLCHRYTKVSGNSTFYDRMSLTGNQRKSFNFTTWTVGFIAKGKLAVYYTWYAGSSHVINNIGNNNSITANIQLD